MNVKVKKISGFEEMFGTMYISKRTWTPELQEHIDEVCKKVLTYEGHLRTKIKGSKEYNEFANWMNMALKMGRRHITILRFLDFSIITEGIHRGGQDDIDAHAERFETRFIRSSTRLSEFGNEKSVYYQDKILTLDEILDYIGIEIPETIEYGDEVYCKTTNGYIKEQYKENKDVKRGLYMLSIPSTFIAKINLCEWGHVFKERNKSGTANPEVKEWAELIADALHQYVPMIDREYLLSIMN